MKNLNSNATSRTDWDRIKRMKHEEIDLSDSPELDADFFAHATLREPTPGPHSVRTFRTDPQTGEEVATGFHGDLAGVSVAAVSIPSNPLSLAQLTLDPAIVEWFRGQSDDPAQLINDTLREFIQAHTSGSPVK
jgi:uncharacterized protein (DUF4415 family)